MRMDGVKFRLAGVDLGTNARAYTELHFDLKRKNTTLRDFQFSVADASMHVGDEDVDGWWAILSSERISASKLPPESYAATIRFRAKDAEPILEALAEKDQLNDLIAKFTSLDDLTLIAKVRGKGPILDVTIESMESDVWDAAGRYYSNGKQSRLALVIGGKAVSIGIASDGKHTSIVPFARTDWLNAQLSKFSKAPRASESVEAVAASAMLGLHQNQPIRLRRRPPIVVAEGTQLFRQRIAIETFAPLAHVEIQRVACAENEQIGGELRQRQRCLAFRQKERAVQSSRDRPPAQRGARLQSLHRPVHQQVALHQRPVRADELQKRFAF